MPSSTTSAPSTRSSSSSSTPSQSSSSSSGPKSPPTYSERAGSASRRAGSELFSGKSPRTHRRSSYSTIVAVEYIACMVMIGLSAGLVGQKNTADVIASPAVAMVRMSAVSILFFVLAILSSGEKAGRVAAAFGGLVTCGVALNATREWKAIANIFSAPKKTSSSSTGSAGSKA